MSNFCSLWNCKHHFCLTWEEKGNRNTVVKNTPKIPSIKENYYRYLNKTLHVRRNFHPHPSSPCTLPSCPGCDLVQAARCPGCMCPEASWGPWPHRSSPLRPASVTCPPHLSGCWASLEGHQYWLIVTLMTVRHTVLPVLYVLYIYGKWLWSKEYLPQSIAK